MKNHSPSAIKGKLAVFQIKHTLLILGITVILPFAVHFLPVYGGFNWGARLLPMFYGPFIAVIFFRPHVGIIVALGAPLLNNLLTFRPDPGLVVSLTNELFIFTVFSYLIYRRWPNFLATAPLSYLLARITCFVLFLLIPVFSANQPTPLFFLGSLKNSLSGILILAAINTLALKLKNKFSVE